jgi:serine/threonine-protein kinase
VILAAGAGITGYLLRQPAATTFQPSTTAQPSATAQPSTASQAVALTAEAALEGLLLSPDQINTAMGATAMTIISSRSGTYDESAVVSDKACLTMTDSAEATAYAGSGSGALRGQFLTETGASYTHLVDQAVVLFPSAHDADAFFTASAQSWPACANRQFTYNDSGKLAVWTVGPVSNINGTLSATKTRVNANGWTCQRALTVAANVAIDVTACTHNQPGPAVNIAKEIAAKVPTT